MRAGDARYSACEYGGDSAGPEAVDETAGLDSMSRARELRFVWIAAPGSRPAGALLRRIVNARTLAPQAALEVHDQGGAADGRHGVHGWGLPGGTSHRRWGGPRFRRARGLHPGPAGLR